jgi:protein tyrosine phosphatase (PTP) superfamily phosphohydrolase (DUF442 family)
MMHHLGQLQEATLEHVMAYVPIHERLASSGQPSALQFELIAQAGFAVVINLALADASNVLHGEDRLVLELGMDYINLPILFDRPNTRQITRVLQLLHDLRDQKVWLHCALNYRVSSVIYLYRVLYLGIDPAEARALLEQVWMPDEVWQGVIDALERLNLTPDTH